jgi:hypothetical protein
MRSKGLWANQAHQAIGETPGVEVGDALQYRAQMLIVGLHRALQAGIAVIPAKLSPHGKSVASSVVLGGKEGTLTSIRETELHTVEMAD